MEQEAASVDESEFSSAAEKSRWQSFKRKLSELSSYVKNIHYGVSLDGLCSFAKSMYRDAVSIASGAKGKLATQLQKIRSQIKNIADNIELTNAMRKEILQMESAEPQSAAVESASQSAKTKKSVAKKEMKAQLKTDAEKAVAELKEAAKDSKRVYPSLYYDLAQKLYDNGMTAELKELAATYVLTAHPNPKIKSLSDKVLKKQQKIAQKQQKVHKSSSDRSFAASENPQSREISMVSEPVELPKVERVTNGFIKRVRQQYFTRRRDLLDEVMYMGTNPHDIVQNGHVEIGGFSTLVNGDVSDLGSGIIYNPEHKTTLVYREDKLVAAKIEGRKGTEYYSVDGDRRIKIDEKGYKQMEYDASVRYERDMGYNEPESLVIDDADVIIGAQTQHYLSTSENEPGIVALRLDTPKFAGKRLPKEQLIVLGDNSRLNLADVHEIDLNSPEIKAKIDNLKDGETLTIGREGDIIVNDPTGRVSKQHLEIKKQYGQIFVSDISANGTKIS